MKKQIEKILTNTELNKSQKILSLYELGIEISEISKLLEIRYNFSYNVISNHCIKTGTEIRKTNKVNKKQLVIELLQQNKSNIEIARELQTNYNYVCKIVKEYYNNNK